MLERKTTVNMLIGHGADVIIAGEVKWHYGWPRNWVIFKIETIDKIIRNLDGTFLHRLWKYHKFAHPKKQRMFLFKLPIFDINMAWLSAPEESDFEYIFRNCIWWNNQNWIFLPFFRVMIRMEWKMIKDGKMFKWI